MVDWTGSIIIELAAGDDPADALVVIKQAFDDSVENVEVSEWDLVNDGIRIDAVPLVWMATI